MPTDLTGRALKDGNTPAQRATARLRVAERARDAADLALLLDALDLRETGREAETRRAWRPWRRRDGGS